MKSYQRKPTIKYTIFSNHLILRTIYAANISNQPSHSLVSQPKDFAKFTSDQFTEEKNLIYLLNVCATKYNQNWRFTLD